MKRQLAFVLGGGGARGALQAGALRALLESGRQPDLLVGCSAGAINAAFLALHGFSLQALDQLDAAWGRTAKIDLLPSNYIWVTLRSMLRAARPTPADRIREFFMANGFTPELRFSDLKGPRVLIVSADLNTGTPVLHGENPDDGVLDALLMSTALPPWAMPVKNQDRYLMDGSIVSALPIEPALKAGATDVVALDLTDPRDPFGQANGFGVFLNKLAYAVEQRQVDLELELARARGVPLLYIQLVATRQVPIWDFRHTAQLIVEGYQTAKRLLEQMPAEGEASPSLRA